MTAPFQVVLIVIGAALVIGVIVACAVPPSPRRVERLLARQDLEDAMGRAQAPRDDGDGEGAA